MRTTINPDYSKKPRTVYPSKKSSNANSLIYQEMNPNKQRNEGERPLTTTASSKKSSLNKKKSSRLDLYKPLINFTSQLQMEGEVTKAVQRLEKKMFSYQYIIGKGGFGKVWKVEHTKTRNQYAMKEMLKSIVMTKKSVQSVMNERVLLSQINSPFIVNMHFAFQDRDTLFLVLDLMEGGDLRYHIGNRLFNEVQSKFFIACIVLGLQDLHTKKIIHRDIKPENLVLDSRGYIRITDLGIARVFRANNSCDTSGTPGYMSPQVICRQNHAYVSDYFAVGIIAYELMIGKRPYNGRSRIQIRDSMLAKQVQVKYNQMPQDWSYQAVDFVNKLIQRKPEHRLGFGGIEEILKHPWLEGIKWDKLRSKEIQSPFVPLMKKNNFDQDQQITIQDQEEAQLIQKNALLLRKMEFQELFASYYYQQQEYKEQKQYKKVRRSQEEKQIKNNTLGYEKQIQKLKYTIMPQSHHKYIEHKQNNNTPQDKQKGQEKKNRDEKRIQIQQYKKYSVEERQLKNQHVPSFKEGLPRNKDKIITKHLETIEVIKDKRKNSGSFIQKSFFKDFRH